MKTDAELLCEFVDRQSEEAFSELVNRHINMVYAAACRMSWGDRSAVEDTVQLVFIELARKAAGLKQRPSLAGWLYATVRYLNANRQRSEQRRSAREKKAFAMNQFDSSTSASPWEELRPVLDEALGELSEADREALLLRFFGGRNLRELGEALRLTETGARMRVERALEKLRLALAKRGILSTSSSLACSLTMGMLAAPPSLSAAITCRALAAVATGSSGPLLRILSAKQLKLTGASAVTLLILTFSAWQVWPHKNQLREPAASGRQLESGTSSLLEFYPASEILPGERGLRASVRVEADPDLQAPTRDLSEIEPWRQRFEAVYTLRDGEVLRHVALPFIPERDQYYPREINDEVSRRIDAPDYLVLCQNEKGLRLGPIGFTDKLDLEHVLRHVLDLPRYKLDGPVELFALPVRGDWIVRDGASMESKMAALGPLLRGVTGRSLTFERHEIDDDVLVVRGGFQPEAGRIIDVFAEEKSTGAGGGSGDFPKFLEKLGDHMNIALVSEVHLLEETPVSWRWHRDSNYSRAGERRAELIGKTLNNLSEQTGLAFELQRQPTQVWQVREAGE